MKKITKILSLTVVVASMMTPLALLANSSNNVNVKQEVNEVGGEATVGLNNVDNNIEANDQAIDVNSVTVNDKVKVNEIISSNDCTAEDSGQTTTAWIGITSGFINFRVSRNYISESQFGEVKIEQVSDINIKSTKLTIPNYIIFDSKKYSVISIGISIFANCTDLTGPLTIPASVASVGNFAFYNCAKLTSLDLSNAASLQIIADQAFQNCNSLRSFDLSNATSLQTIGASVFSNCTGITGPLTIPASVRTIGSSAFGNCTGLTSLDLSNATSLQTIDTIAFLSCNKLSGRLIIPENLTFIGKRAFQNCNFTSIEVNSLNSKYALALKETVGDASVVIDKKIYPNLNYDYAREPVGHLACGGLFIPASVTNIQQEVFKGCISLTSLDLSKATSLTTIGDGAFQGCISLTSLDLSNTTSLTTIGNFAFGSCDKLTDGLTISANVTSIGDGAFFACSDLTSLDLTNATNLTSIGDTAFKNCTGLTGPLTIPASVTSIGDEAFFSIGSQEFKFLSEIPPATLGTNIFGTNVNKTLWVPSAQAKALYDPLAQSNFGLTNSSYIKIAPTSVDITNLNGTYTINLNEANKTIATAKADVKPVETTNIDVTWSLENAPTWLKIDANGNITANDGLKNVTPGKFTFKVKVECQADSNISNITNDIQLNVTYAPITSLAIQPIVPVEITLNARPATLTTCKAIISPIGYDPAKIKWSIPNNKPTWLDINPTTGVISTNSPVEDKNLPISINYTIQVDSTDGTNLSANTILTIYFIKPKIIPIEIIAASSSGAIAFLGIMTSTITIVIRKHKLKNVKVIHLI